MTSLSILTLHGFLLFVGAELIFSLTPGPTVMLISAYGFKGGFRDALAAIAGTQTGNTLWYVICVTGLGALVTASPTVFHAIRLLGAAYLVFLGVSGIRAFGSPNTVIFDIKHVLPKEASDGRL